MKIYFLVAAYFVLAGQTTLKNEKLNPLAEEKELQLEEMNPSPNPVPQENESDVFRGSTINHRAVQEQEEESSNRVKNDSVKEKSEEEK